MQCWRCELWSATMVSALLREPVNLRDHSRRPSFWSLSEVRYIVISRNPLLNAIPPESNRTLFSIEQFPDYLTKNFSSLPTSVSQDRNSPLAGVASDHRLIEWKPP